MNTAKKPSPLDFLGELPPYQETRARKFHDYAIQAAWRADERQYCIEFDGEHKYYWMLCEMAKAIDPTVVAASRQYSFMFSSRALAEVFVDNAVSLPDRIAGLLRSANPQKQDGRSDGNGGGQGK